MSVFTIKLQVRNKLLRTWHLWHQILMFKPLLFHLKGRCQIKNRLTKLNSVHPTGTETFTIADIFDALYTDRPYRKGMSLEKAMAILNEDVAHGKLDPNIVGHLETLMNSGELAKIYDGN